MRKTIFMTLALVLGLGLLATGAWGDIIFPDNTLVQPWNQNGVSTWNGGALIDVIASTGDHSFDNLGAIFSSGNLIITTNWNPNRDGYLGVTTADLFVTSGANSWAIHLDTLSGTGGVYINPTFQTTQDLFSIYPSDVYGGRYDSNGVLNVIPSLATGGTNDGTVPVVWTINGLGNLVDVNLSSLAGFDPNNFSFTWAGGTCGNDTIYGAAAPIPATALLLGSGLLGLVGLGWRRKKG